METRDWRPDPKNSDIELWEAPGIVNELNGVLMSAARARERRTNSAAMNPPGVTVTPLKCNAAGDSDIFFCVSCKLTMVLATAPCKSVTLPFNSVTAACCWLAEA